MKYIPILVIFFLSMSFTSVQSQEENPIVDLIYSPDTKPFGLSYEEHVKNFWKQLVEIPQNENPLNFESSEKCNASQSLANYSSIIYLLPNAEGETTTECVFPAGKGLLITIITSLISQGEGLSNSQDINSVPVSTVHDLAKTDADRIVTYDGKENFNKLKHAYLQIGDNYLYELEKYRVHTKNFTAVYPSAAIFNAAAGAQQVVVDGYYVITKPLLPGEYHIEFAGQIPYPNDPYGTHSIYKITVK